MSVFKRAKTAVDERGVLGTIAHIPRFIYKEGVRPFLPTQGRAQYNSMVIPADKRYGDELFPSHHWTGPGRDRPLYEDALISGLKEHVNQGDKVMIVGGGWGVTASVAAEQVEEEGSVVVYEGATECVNRIKEVAHLNNTPDITVHNAVVGNPISLYGDGMSATSINPEDLPACDVLEIDAEGTELEILDDIEITPDVILVETHGHLGAPSDAVHEKLQKHDYRVVDQRPAEPASEQECIEKDVFVLTAIKQSNKDN